MPEKNELKLYRETEGFLSRIGRSKTARRLALTAGILGLLAGTPKPSKAGEVKHDTTVTSKFNYTYPYQGMFQERTEKSGNVTMEVTGPRSVNKDEEAIYTVTLTSTKHTFDYNTLIMGAEKGTTNPPHENDIEVFLKYYIKRSDREWELANRVSPEMHDLKWTVLGGAVGIVDKSTGSLIEILNVLNKVLFKGYKNEIKKNMPDWARSSDYEIFGLFNAPEGATVSEYRGIKWQVPVRLEKDGTIKFCTISGLYLKTPALECEIPVDIQTVADSSTTYGVQKKHKRFMIQGDWVTPNEINRNPDGSYAYDFGNVEDVMLARAESINNADSKLFYRIIGEKGKKEAESKAREFGMPTLKVLRRVLEGLTKYEYYCLRFKINETEEYGDTCKVYFDEIVRQADPDSYWRIRYEEREKKRTLYMVNENGEWKCRDIFK